MIQGSQEWKDARLGWVTASRFADVMTQPRGKAASLSQTADSYMLDLVGEWLTGQQASTFESFAMKRGTELEPLARDAYSARTGRAVFTTGFVRHPTESLVGCSPDGVIGDDGGIEIKCPETYKAHVRVLVSGEMPEEHTAQVQGAMWVTGREWWDFVSFDPRMPNDATQLMIVRVPRDEAYIVELADRVVKFRDVLVTTLRRVLSRVGDTKTNNAIDMIAERVRL